MDKSSLVIVSLVQILICIGGTFICSAAVLAVFILKYLGGFIT